MSDKFSPNRFVMLFFILLVLGVLVAAGIAWNVTQDLGQTLIVAIIYGMFIIGLGFAVMWQRIERPLAGGLAEWLRSKVGAFFDRYAGHYARYLDNRYRAFEIKGLSAQTVYTLELNKLFVELRLLPRLAYQAFKDPLQTQQIALDIPEELRRGSRPIWEYLRSKQMANQHLVIIGPPGSGKTTLLKHITLTLVAGRGQRRRVQASHQTPILLFLREHSAAILADPNFDLIQAIQDSLRHWDTRRPIPPSWFEQRLSRGHCLIMLDGLDEVADPAQRQKVVVWVKRQMVAHRDNRFIMTSRPYGYLDNPLGDVVVLEARPFAAPQIKDFIERWYQANEVINRQQNDPGVSLSARQGAEDLLQRLRQAPALLDLAVNPLLLLMMATLYRYRSSLPGQRVELYAEICELFLDQRQQVRGLELELTPAQKQRVLQFLAYEMMVNGQREISQAEALAIIEPPLQLVSPETRPLDFLKSVENRSGLLLERESGEYSFAHPTFQEYLAAVHLKEMSLEAEVAARVAQSWWRETIRLYCAQSDATPIIAACISDDKPSVTALTLASECLEEADEAQPATRQQLGVMLAAGIEDKDPARRHLITERLLALRLRRLRRVSEDKYVDDGLISQAEYQLFLDEARAAGDYYQPDHWLTLQFPQEQAYQPAVGVRPGDAEAFCRWLTGREGGLWRYRLPLAEEFDEAITAEVKTGYWVATENNSYRLAGVDLPNGHKLEEQVKKNYARDRDHHRTRALDLARAHALDRARALTRVRDFARALTRDLALARDLTRALTRDLALARDLARALDRDLARASDRDHARARARDFARDLALARDLDRTLARDLAHDLAHDLSRARDLARDLARALDRDRDIARDLSLDLSLDLGRERNRNRESDLALILDRALALTLDLANAFNHDRIRALDRARARARSFARAHARAFDRALALNYILDRNLAALLDRPQHLAAKNEAEATTNFLRRYIRLAALSQAESLLTQQKSTSWVERLGLADQSATEVAKQKLLETYVDLYLDFVILEARVAGELPALEGIRLVKERLPGNGAH